MKQVLSTMMVLGLVFSVASTASARTTAKDSAYAVKNGSYRKSCQQIKVSSTGINAVCRTIKGEWVKTSLSLTAGRCTEIENINGDLVCTMAD